ncbi:MAG: SDR family NAD(P)-dependent oxidoreductase, partial [Mycobacteriales bacterium]
MSSDLKDQVAIVTGGSRGLGREMVLAFAAAGADVVIASRKLPSCQAVAAELDAAHGVRCLPVEYHAARWDDSDRLADDVLR